jgi:hypothetical protein
MPTSTPSPRSWTLREIARLERGGLRPPRLTEPDHERWHRLRRKLGWVAFIDLLHEDLAEAFPTSFALDRWSAHPTVGLDEAAAKALIDEAAQTDDADRLAFLRLACRGLGLMEGGNIAMLPAAAGLASRFPAGDGGPSPLGYARLAGLLLRPDARATEAAELRWVVRPRGGKHGLVVLAAPGGIHEDRGCLDEKYNLPYTPDMAAVYLEMS